MNTVVRHFLRCWLLKYAPKPNGGRLYGPLVPKDWQHPASIGMYGEEESALDRVYIRSLKAEAAFWRWLKEPDAHTMWDRRYGR